MANNKQTVSLLRKNKQEQVAVLQELGFTNVTATTKASLFPIYVKWANGLLDCTIAVNRLSDGRAFYFSKEEWILLPQTTKAQFLIRGIRLRSHGMSFVMAISALTGAPWGPASDIARVPNYQGSGELYSDRKAEEYNQIILSSISNGNGDTAIELCRDYKAFTQEIDGREDTSTWVMGTVAHYMEVQRYRKEIDDCMAAALGEGYRTPRNTIMTCLEYDATKIWCVTLSSGYVYYEYNKTSTSYYYLPISIEA